jgi:two-component system, OmpR family, sensor kinase
VRPRSGSLRMKITLAWAAGSLLVFALGAAFFYRDFINALDDSVTRALIVRVEDLSVVPALDRATLEADGQVVFPSQEPPLVEGEQLAAALEGRVQFDTTIEDVGEARVVAQPVVGADGSTAVVAAARSLGPVNRARERLALELGIGLPLMVGVMAVGGWALTGAALRPVRRMSRQAASISADRTGSRLPQPSGRDEIAELGHTLNQMLDRIEAMVVRERAFVDDASHEFRSPLAVLRGELELALLTSGTTKEIGARLQSALEETDRLAHLADELLVLARADAGQIRLDGGPVDVRERAGAVAERLRPIAPNEIRVTGPAAEASIEGPLADRIVENLLMNAVRHARGVVQLTVAPTDQEVVLTVGDDGAGFEPSRQQDVFDRFAVGDRSRGRTTGAGLGLAIVRALTEASGGRVEAGRDPVLGGALVTVHLPAAGSHRRLTGGSPASSR